MRFLCTKMAKQDLLGYLSKLSYFFAILDWGKFNGDQ